MVKKLFHILFAIILCALFSAVLVVAFYYLYLHIYRINIILPQTYAFIAQYWNSGKVLSGHDLIMLFGFVVLVIVNFCGWWYISHCKLMKLLTVPLNWLANLGFGEYKTPNVNIKNLKVEEKKTLEQIVQERIDVEKKKNPQPDSGKFRQDIIERIENEKNNQM